VQVCVCHMAFISFIGPRCSVSIGRCKIILPSSDIVLFGRMGNGNGSTGDADGDGNLRPLQQRHTARMLIPAEAFLLQGWHLPTLLQEQPRPNDPNLSYRDLLNLAGNAFHSGCFAACFVASLVAVPWNLLGHGTVL